MKPVVSYRDASQGNVGVVLAPEYVSIIYDLCCSVLFECLKTIFFLMSVAKKNKNNMEYIEFF